MVPMKSYLSTASLTVVLLTSCTTNKTLFISNRTGNPITLMVDSTFMDSSAKTISDSLNGLKIEDKKVFDYGKGKWTKEDKSKLEEVLKHTKSLSTDANEVIEMSNKTKVSHIRFIVEELWIKIK